MNLKVFAFYLLAGVTTNQTLNPAFDFAMAIVNLGVERGNVSVTGPSGFGAKVSLSLAGFRTIHLPWVAAHGGASGDPFIAYQFNAPEPEVKLPSAPGTSLPRGSPATPSPPNAPAVSFSTIAAPPSTTWSPLPPVRPPGPYGSFDMDPVTEKGAGSRRASSGSSLGSDSKRSELRGGPGIPVTRD